MSDVPQPPPPMGKAPRPIKSQIHGMSVAERRATRRPGEYVNKAGYVADPPPDLSEYPDPPEYLAECVECEAVHYTRNGHESCADHTSFGLPCRKAPMPGSHLCAKHGVYSRTHKERDQRLAEERAVESLARLNITPIGNPLDHLADLAGEALSIKQHFADLVSELKNQMRYRDDKGGEQLRSEVVLYERALDRAQKFLTELAKVGFEEQRMRLDEGRLELMKTFIVHLVTGLGHDLDTPQVRDLIERLAPILDGEPPPAIETIATEETG